MFLKNVQKNPKNKKVGILLGNLGASLLKIYSVD